MEAPTPAPDAAAFPSWPTDDYIFSGTTLPNSVGYAMVVHFGGGNIAYLTRGTTYYVALLRGG
jgi:hypothetical protein